jgi:hypothetical protein
VHLVTVLLLPRFYCYMAPIARTTHTMHHRGCMTNNSDSSTLYSCTTAIQPRPAPPSPIHTPRWSSTRFTLVAADGRANCNFQSASRRQGCAKSSSPLTLLKRPLRLLETWVSWASARQKARTIRPCSRGHCVSSVFVTHLCARFALSCFCFWLLVPTTLYPLPVSL